MLYSYHLKNFKQFTNVENDSKYQWFNKTIKYRNEAMFVEEFCKAGIFDFFQLLNSHWRAAHEFQTFFNVIRFCRHLALLDERTELKYRPCRSQPHISCERNNTKSDCDSAIGQHLLDNDQGALNHDNKQFSILAASRISFHLNLVEAAYIKTRRPVLCRQKGFAYILKLFR